MKPPHFGIGEHIERLGRIPRLAIGVLLLASGVIADVISGRDFTVLLFFIAAVTFAAWYVSARFAVVVSCACTISAFLVENPVADGLPTAPLAYWNTLMRLPSFLLVIWLTREKRADFERIRESAARDARALRAEQSFSHSLQNELAVREAEQRRIGRDLHDGLSQHLTATMLASKILEERLADRSLGEASAAGQITDLLNDALVQVQDLTRGLYPADVVTAGLPCALTRLAATTQRLSGVPCHFTAPECDLGLDEAMTTHLYRIAQEALSNAVRHGKPRCIRLALAIDCDAVGLSVTDDGIGMSEPKPSSGGLGMRTMCERARTMGGTLEVSAPAAGGTRVVCSVPRSRTSSVNGRLPVTGQVMTNGSSHAASREAASS